MDFTSKFKEYCDYDGWIPSFLWRDESVDKLNQLISLYKKSGKSYENKFLIDELVSYEIASENKSEQILKKNLIKIIEELSNKDLLSSDMVKKIKEILISKIQKHQKQIVPVYSKVAEEVYLLLQLSPTLSEIKSIFNENLTIDWYDWFFYYCIKSEDNRIFFNELLQQYIKLFETRVIENEYEYFILGADKYIEYVAKDKKTNETFLILLSRNLESLKSFFNWYYSNGKEAPFLKGDSIYVQNCIWALIKEYYETKNYRIDRIFKQNLFQLIIKSQQAKSKFVSKLFAYLNDEKRQYFSVSPIILKWLLTKENIDTFLLHKRWNRTILDLYYFFKNEWNQILLKKIYEAYESIISKNDEYIKESKEKITLEEEGIKLKIKEIIDSNIQLRKTTKLNYFVSNILFLYENHKNLFDDYQKNFVKNQIHLYLTSSNTNPWDSRLWIEYSKENSFSWPWFIQDLELCIEIALSENMDLSEYKERILYLIPYLFDSDYKKLIDGFDKDLNITDSKLIDWILDVYSHESNKWLWYFHASRLISILNDNILSIKNFNQKQIKRLWEICKNMILSKENRISIWDKNNYCDFVIRNKDEWIDSYWMFDYYKQESKKYKRVNYFDNYLRHNTKDMKGFELFVAINKCLILLFKDKDAIDWRFSQLLWIKEDFEEIDYSWVRGVSELERELTYWNYNNEFFYSVLIKVSKYPEYEGEMKTILNKAQKLWDKSKFKTYLRNFVAIYYKNIPEEDKAETYANIDDKDFVVYYLGVSNWDDFQKIKYKIEKKNKDICKFEEDIKIYDTWLKAKEMIIKEKENEIINLQKEKSELENEVVIITEWKTDRKILKAMAYQLKKESSDEDAEIYDFFLRWIHEYENMEAWDKPVFNLIKSLAELFPKKYFIWIFDTDWILKKWETNSFSKQLNEVWDNEYEFEKGPKNIRIVKLTEPRWHNYKRNIEYYDNSWWSIELLYSKNRLWKYFFVPRDCNLEEIASYPDKIFKGKYKNKIIYTKEVSTTVYDKNNIPPIISNDIWKARIVQKLRSKNEFAEGIKNWTICIPKKECKIFSKLFKIIYDAYKNMKEML